MMFKREVFFGFSFFIFPNHSYFFNSLKFKILFKEYFYTFFKPLFALSKVCLSAISEFEFSIIFFAVK